MKKLKVMLFAALLSVCCSMLVSSGKAQASSDSILQKWTRINAYECIVDNSLLHSPVSPKRENGDLRTNAVLDLVTSYETNWIATPSLGFGGTTPGSNVACRYVIDGSSGKYNGMTNLLTYGGKTSLSGIKWNDSNPSKVEELLTTLGYTGEEAEDGGGRFSITAHRSTEICKSTLFSSSSSCSTSEGEEVSTVGITATRQADGSMYYERDSGNLWNDLKVSFEDSNLILKVSKTGCSGGGSLEIPLERDLNTMYSNLSDALTNTTWTVSCTKAELSLSKDQPITITNYRYTFGVSNKIVDSSEISQYVLEGTLISIANKVNRNLTGSVVRALTNTEKYELYDYYLNKVIAMGGAEANRKTCNPTSTTNLQPVKLLDTSDNTFKTCYVNLGTLDASSTKVNAPNDDHSKIIEISIADVISRLDNLNTSDIDISAITGVNSSDDPYAPLPGDGGEEGEGDEANCFTNGSSLGWILCPVLELMGSATSGLYDWMSAEWLGVGTTEMQYGGSVYNGWKDFRDLANIAFVIILLVVIFSQVTGIGLNNYGIKKILPSLIIVAVLVNLSFIICQLAVDVTNILGDSLKNTFEGLEVGGGQPANLLIGSISTFIQAGGVVAAGAAITLSGGLDFGGILVAALGAFIVALFGIIFFFLILAVRKAAVFALVVLAPAAIVCYALPNTKNLFRKWFKAFTSLLLVYPICSIMMGGGQFFSSILLGSKEEVGFFMALAAMLLQIVPFFLIPSMVKGSLAAIGSIGAKLSQTGKKWGGLASGKFTRSDAAKRLQSNATNWGRQHPINNKLRNMRGIGRVVRGIEDNKLATAVRNSKMATANRARKDALAKNAVDQIRRQDNLAVKRAAWSDSDVPERALANDDLKLQRELADNELDSLNATSTYRTSDGAVHRFNNNDPGNIQEQLQTLEEDLAAHPGDMKIMIRIEAMKKLLQTKFGSKGASLVSETLYNQVYDEHGNMTNDPAQLAHAEALAQQFARDDKLMAELHRNDPGTEQFINDLANRSAVDENGRETQTAIDAQRRLSDGRAGYGAFSAGKVKPANLADSADTLINNMGKMNPNSTEFKQLAETFRQAIADYRTGSNFKANDIKKINEMLKNSYDLERDAWLGGSTNGVNNYESLTGYADDGNGNMIEVHADGIENGNLVRHITNSNGQVIRQELHASANATSAVLSAKSAYSQQISAFTPTQVGQPQLKIQQLRELPGLPEGYDKDGHWDYAKMQRTETQRDKLTYKNWVDRTLAIEQANEQARKINAELASIQHEYEVKIQHPNGSNP